MEKTNVQLLKLISGEEVIVEIVSKIDDTLLEIRNAIVMVPDKRNQDNLSPMPWLPLCDMKISIMIEMHNIVAIAPPVDEIVNIHRRVTSTIDLPSQPEIITG